MKCSGARMSSHNTQDHQTRPEFLLPQAMSLCIIYKPTFGKVRRRSFPVWGGGGAEVKVGEIYKHDIYNTYPILSSYFPNALQIHSGSFGKESLRGINVAAACRKSLMCR